MLVQAYLTFNGNCRQAMGFYQSCLGGTLDLQTIGSSPLCASMPRQMQSLILHASLTNGLLTLLATDMAPADGLQKGNSVSLSLTCTSEQQVRRLYHSLSQGGRANHPPERSYWGALFGDLTDKFGHHWLLNYPTK